MPTSLDPQPAENELECGNCGKYFYVELTRCPHCGASVYPPDEGGDAALSHTPRAENATRKGISARLDDFIHRLLKKPYAVDKLFGAAIHQAGLFDDLVRKTGGDSAAAERLIQFEQNLLPDGNRLTWTHNAIQRWERDNRGGLS